MTTSSSNIQKALNLRIDNPLYNTSYPLSPSDWAEYSVEGLLPFDWSRPIAFYLHIPFCKRLCSFCEYCRTILPSPDLQSVYLKTVRKDIENFLSHYVDIQLYGFDIGGGTPTALDDTVFCELMDIYQFVIVHAKLVSNFEPSIEGTFETLTPQKAKLIADAGIHRISLGIQSSSSSVLSPLNRQNNDLDSMRRIVDFAHNAGIRKINFDLMYGLPGQSVESINNDISVISQLRPEQVTVYELRTNQLKTGYKVNNQFCYDQYTILYDGLISLGYHSEFGQNTFSINSHDKGLSSYLRHRMFDGWQYKGFGISAQSMSRFGVSYNVGKNQSINKLINCYRSQRNGYYYEANEYYQLPRQEVLSKFIAISGYSGGFSLSAAQEIYGTEFATSFNDVLKYLILKKFVSIKRDRVQCTKEGFRHYGAILSMFHSPI